MTTRGTRADLILQVPAKRVAQALPGTLGVSAAQLEITSERTPHAGTHSRRFAALWSKGTVGGVATIEIAPASKVSTKIAVELSRPSGVWGWLWLRPSLRRLGEVFARALAYEVETRHIEEADAFEVRRTTRELVRARTA
jgi:hypothetical protein